MTKGEPMGMLDHLGCLAILAYSGGRADITVTLLKFRDNLQSVLDDEVSLQEPPIMPTMFDLCVLEMQLVRVSYEEATEGMWNRN